ncbi:ABC transporter ATP-binding protein [Magnetospirillum molischianum]|uniref:Hemin/siderophore import ATP-binding protein n=1 Tax=Magnetospirillum molischianum DSM 120 TaxID=1150626 RepID=H8FSS4_MAGML|nr:ABC transporter ATP-binding protein [Magnetospirillum molischianum]CCG41412.1 Hemin/siderophore import ATP-binding protein [Magnetospirillum molischianum DSM 120]
MTTLEWRGICLDRGGQRVLDQIDLSLTSGELLGIVGPNGAGKSALLRCAAGLDRPATGEVRLDGQGLTSLTAGSRARRLAYLPQSAEAAWPIPVRAAVALGRLPHGGCATDQAAITRALEAVEMSRFSERPLSTLSGGERALVLLARALAVEADILLLDEPCAALDPHHQLAVLELLRRQAEAGCAVGLVLHDLSLAARFCHRIVLLAEGRTLAVGPPETALSDAMLAQAYAIRGHRVLVEGKWLLVPWERLPSE